MEKKKNTVPEIAPEVREAEEKAIVNALVAKVKAAQEIFANYTQEKVDKMKRLTEEIETTGKVIPDNFAAQLAKLGY